MEFDFSKFVASLEKEENKKAELKLVADENLNRIRARRTADIKYQNIIWVSSGK